MTCPVCNMNMDVNRTVMHHISYFPEVKIRVHKKCHFIIHNTDKYPELKPKKEDTKKFYLGSETAIRPPRPEIDDESYAETIKEAQKTSPIPITNFQDGLTIILSELRRLRSSKK